MNAHPAAANAHQHRVPKWYSHLMTIGWNTPMTRNVVTKTFFLYFMSKITSSPVDYQTFPTLFELEPVAAMNNAG